MNTFLFVLLTVLVLCGTYSLRGTIFDLLKISLLCVIILGQVLTAVFYIGIQIENDCREYLQASTPQQKEFLLGIIKGKVKFLDNITSWITVPSVDGDTKTVTSVALGTHIIQTPNYVPVEIKNAILKGQ